MTEAVELSVACPDRATATALADAAVAARLVACANIHGPVLSVFHWEGKLERAEEYVVHFKTAAARLDALRKLIAAQHPYDLPAVTWSQVACDAATASWIAEETANRH